MLAKSGLKNNEIFSSLLTKKDFYAKIKEVLTEIKKFRECQKYPHLNYQHAS